MVETNRLRDSFEKLKEMAELALKMELHHMLDRLEKEGKVRRTSEGDLEIINVWDDYWNNMMINPDTLHKRFLIHCYVRPKRAKDIDEDSDAFRTIMEYVTEHKEKGLEVVFEEIIEKIPVAVVLIPVLESRGKIEKGTIKYANKDEAMNKVLKVAIAMTADLKEMVKENDRKRKSAGAGDFRAM